MYEYKTIKLKDGTTRDEHRLLMEAHLGRRLTINEVVHHRDGDKRNNALDNLEVMTRAEHSRLHVREQWANGERVVTYIPTPLYGCDNPSSKLSADDIKGIKRILADKAAGLDTISIRQIARNYSVSHQTILRIRDNERYTKE